MPLVRSDFSYVADEDGAVILDIENDALVSLNSTGGYVWERLQKQTALEDIVRDLANKTGVDPSIVDADVRAFLDQLTTKGLLR